MKPEDVIMCFLVLLLIAIVVGMPLWCIMQEHIKREGVKTVWDVGASAGFYSQYGTHK